MDNLQVVRTPELIAAEIRHLHVTTQKLYNNTQKTILFNAIEIGRKLTEAKSLIPHGEWSSWLQNSVDYKQSTANNFMRLFEEYGAEQITLLADQNTKNPAFDKLTYSQAVALLALPEDERVEFLEDNNVEEMSTRELKEAIKARQDAEQKLKDAEDRERELSEQIKKLSAENTEAIRQEKEAVKKAENEVRELQKKIKELEESADAAEASEPEDADEIDIEEERQKIREELKTELQKETEEKVQEKEREKQRLMDELASKQKEVELRDKKIKELQAIGGNEDTQLFKVLFDQTVQSFDKLIKQVGKIKASDPDAAPKYINAIEKALQAMGEELSKHK